MRKPIVLVLANALLAGVLIGPAVARDGITFEASGSFASPNIVRETGVAPARNWGVTGSEFVESCAIPSTQGFDGYVVELSDEMSSVSAEVTIEWSDMAGIYETGISTLYVVFFDASCTQAVFAWYPMDGTDDTFFEAGTRYILVSAKLEAMVDFTLAAVEVGSRSQPQPAPAPDGSPAPEPSPTAQPGTVDRSVDLALRGHIRARGTVVSDDDGCRSSVSVVIERKAARGWAAIGSATTDAEGDFRLNLPDRAGRYRALAPEISDPERTCLSAVSEKVRHEH